MSLSRCIKLPFKLQSFNWSIYNRCIIYFPVTLKKYEMNDNVIQSPKFCLSNLAADWLISIQGLLVHGANSLQCWEELS